MATSLTETQVTWGGGNASATISSSSIVWSDEMSGDADAWEGLFVLSADNTGTPASGDTCIWYIRRTAGDVLGDSGNDYDTDEHAQWLATLDTYATNTPGEDPARKSVDAPFVGTGYQLGAKCANAATRNVVVRARLVAHRA